MLSLLGSEDREALSTFGYERDHPRGAALVRQGERSRSAFVVLTGRVKVIVVTRDGRELLVELAGPGDLLGELAAFDDAPRSATIVAMDHVRALWLGREAIVRFLSERPEALAVWLGVLARRTRIADRRLLDAHVEDTATRLARRLLELAARHGRPVEEGLVLDVTLTQDELASWIGTSREVVNHHLSEWRSADALRTARRRITLTDLEVLRRAAIGTS